MKEFNAFRKIFCFSVLMFCLFNSQASAQKIGFVSSDQIRELFPEAMQADQRIETIRDEWKRELKELDQQIDAKQFEIEKNRLVWTDEEKTLNNNQLEQIKSERMQFAKNKYAVGGEYDQIIKAILKPVEEKIYAAIQKVSAQLKYDIVWDKSTQPLSYVNFKYDLTLKVLKELGVDVAALEAEQQEKISKDPRNQVSSQSTSTTTKKRTRKRRTEKSKDTEVQTTTTDENPTTKVDSEPTTSTSTEAPVEIKK